SLEGRIGSLGLDGTVVLAGWREDVPALMASADLFVLPSRFEGLPNSVIEAMASGLPVVATAVAGTPELVEEGVTGWLVPPGVPRDLAAAIVTGLSAPAAEVAEAAKRRAAEGFSAEAMAHSFADLYQELGAW